MKIGEGGSEEGKRGEETRREERRVECKRREVGKIQDNNLNEE